jgi:hypothetical protein
MPKKDWTPEERAAFSAKMKALAAAKKAKAEEEPQQAQPTYDEIATATANDTPVDHGTPGQADYAELQAQMNELKGYLFDILRNKETPSQNGPQVTTSGVVGTIEKYVLDPARYPNPCERLSKEAKLQRFAFDMNFELEWNVKVTQYDTKDGLHVKEPRFEIQLNRIVMDDETGEPTDGRYVITKGTFHEDPQAALIVAREQGINVDGWEEKAFLDEMRYLRIRDWLMEAFYTPLIDKKKTNIREIAIGGRMVQYFEVNAKDGDTGMTKSNWDSAPRIKF